MVVPIICKEFLSNLDTLKTVIWLVIKTVVGIYQSVLKWSHDYTNFSASWPMGDCTGSCKSNYHTTMTMTAPQTEELSCVVCEMDYLPFISLLYLVLFHLLHTLRWHFLMELWVVSRERRNTIIIQFGDFHFNINVTYNT